MAGISKRIRGSWVSSNYGVMKTATDTITTLPAVLYPNDTTATVGSKGNTAQNGTPTPQSPVMPNGTGERTGNLWDNLGFSADAINTSGIHTLSNNYGTSLSTVSGGSVDITQVASGSTTAYQNGFFFIEIDISQFSLNDNIVISFDYEITNKAGSTSTTVSYVGQGTTGTTVIANWSESGRAIIKAAITSAMTKPYVEIRLCGNSIKVKNVQINTGSTALPYEPYGYKLNISSASTTTPVYLGEVETTRRVKKLVLTGEENWNTVYGVTMVNALLNNAPFIPTIVALSDRYVYNPIQSGLSSGLRDGEFALQRSGISSPYTYNIAIKDNRYTTVADIKSYLAAQYAAGTPVTVWYVLANEETAVVNEPLMRIGDYADTVSGISIPVTAGGETISVETTVPPSEVTVNYKGWHPAIVHERTNGTWT